MIRVLIVTSSGIRPSSAYNIYSGILFLDLVIFRRKSVWTFLIRSKHSKLQISYAYVSIGTIVAAVGLPEDGGYLFDRIRDASRIQCIQLYIQLHNVLQHLMIWSHDVNSYLKWTCWPIVLYQFQQCSHVARKFHSDIAQLTSNTTLTFQNCHDVSNQCIQRKGA